MQTKIEIKPLTGLRGVAALLVLWAHYFSWAAPYDWQTSPRWMYWIFATPEYGMTLFFTLSGFVIAYNYLDMPWAAAPLKSAGIFVWARVTRLLPAMLLFCIMILNTAPWSKELGSGFALWTVFHLIGVESWLPLKMNGVLQEGGNFFLIWSISTELGMYLVFAGVLIVAAKMRARPRAYAIGFAIYLVALFVLWRSPTAFDHLMRLVPVPGQPPDEAQWRVWFFYISPYYRFAEFSLGAFCAVAVLRHGPALSHWARYLRVVAISGATVLMLGHVYVYAISSQPGSDIIGYRFVMSICFSTILLYAAASETGRLGRFLTSPILMLVGLSSYSLYLFHPFLARLFVRSVGGPFRLSLLPQFALNLGGSLLFSLAFAYGIYFLLERPAQSALRALIRSPRTRAAPANIQPG